MKKLISIMLSLLMVLAIVPIATLSVSAAEYTITSEAELAEYISNGSQDTITLGDDIIVTSSITNKNGKADTLLLNGHTITYQPYDNDVAEPMMNILDSTYDQSTLIIKNDVADKGGFVNNSSAPLFKTTGKGTIKFSSGNIDGDIYAIINGNNPLSFEGDDVIINGKLKIEGAVKVSKKSTFNNDINCSSLECNSDAIFNGEVTADKLNLSKGKFNVINSNKSIITTGAVNATKVNASVAAIGGGAVIDTITAEDLKVLKGTINLATVNLSGVMTGGTVNKLTALKDAEFIIAGGTTNAVDGEGSIAAKAGKFNFDPTDIMVEDAAKTQVGETYTVSSYAFEVNGAKFVTLQNAHDAAIAGKTIKLITDYYISSENTTLLTLSKDNITLDLNGYTISDLSDTGAFSGCNKFLVCNTAINKFKLTDSTYETTGGGKIVIHGGGSNSGTDFCFSFKAISDSTMPIDLTFENCTVNTNTSCYVNNGGIMNLAGGSIADNTLKFKNFTLKNITTSGNTGQGYNGILISAKFDVITDNFNYMAERNAFMCNVNNISFNFKNSNISYARTSGINLSYNKNINTNCVINAENTTFSNTTDWGGNIITIGDKIQNTKQTFKNCKFNLYRGACIVTSGVTNTINITDCTFTNLNSGSVYPITVGGTDTMKLYNTEFLASSFESRIAVINDNATLILDKNSKAINNCAKNSGGSGAAFLMNGKSEDAKANLIVNHFTATGYRNFVQSKNNYSNIYIEDFSFEKDEGKNPWNGGGSFVDKGTVTLGEGYNVYVDGKDEPTENFNWLSSSTIGKVFVNNPNLRIVTVDGETYKVNSGSTFKLPENTDPNFKGYTQDYKTLLQPGEEVTVNESMTFNSITKILENADFTIDTADKVFTGSPIKTTVTTAIADDNYEVSYENNTNVGEAIVTITGKKSSFGTVTSKFNITPKDLDENDFIIDNDDKTYTGNEIKPVITSNILTSDDFEVSYNNNINVGTATITVTGKGNYGSYFEKEFNILKRTISEKDFTFNLNDQTYTRSEIKPEVTAKKLADTDFKVEYSNNINKGQATITVTGIGNNCEGEVIKNFNIVEKAIAEDDFTIDLGDKVYTNSEIKPEVTAYVLSSEDYDVVYTDNINVGTATITITGKGNYKGEVVKHFNITAKEITDADFTFDLTDRVYTGSEIKPDVTSTLGESDYEVAYSNNTNAGEATITVTGKGNYKGEVVKHFNINAKALTDADFDTIADQVYANKELNPEVKVLNELITLNDYEVAYENNENVGEATVTITGKNNFSGEVVKHFNITFKTIAEDDFTFDLINKVYTGSEIKPDVTSATLKDTDFEVIYTDNINKGTATITVNGKNNCSGQIVKTFNIVEKEILESDFTFDLTDKVYTGSEIKPEVTSTLGEADYEVAYSQNINKGTATITVTGIGNYAGQIVKTFNILTKDIVDSDFTINTTAETYSGVAITKAITTKLVLDKDYKVAYTNNINAGTATVTVTGIGNYSSTITKTFVINPKAIDASMFVINTSAVTYTGKENLKDITSALTLDKDYTITYANNVNVGTATITIKGNGNYTGEISSSFTINKPTVTVKIKKVSAKSTAKKKLTVKWKKTKNIDGYAIKVSLKKSLKGKGTKTIYVKNAKTAKKVVAKLKQNKKYFVGVAGYKNYKNNANKQLKSIGKYSKIKKAVTIK